MAIIMKLVEMIKYSVQMEIAHKNTTAFTQIDNNMCGSALVTPQI